MPAPPPAATATDPDWRVARARKAGLANRRPDALIKSLERVATDLTDDQRARLAAILATPRRAD